jgi:hypothetical protein
MKPQLNRRWLIAILLLFFTAASITTVIILNTSTSSPNVSLQAEFETAATVDGNYRSIVNTAPVFDFQSLVEPNVEPLIAFIKVTNVGDVPFGYSIGFIVKQDSLAPAVHLDIQQVEQPEISTIQGEALEDWMLDGGEMNPNEFNIIQMTLRLDETIMNNEFNLEEDDPRFPLTFEFDMQLMLSESIR